jgi:chromosomal replication initiation ATPase DnaA
MDFARKRPWDKIDTKLILNKVYLSLNVTRMQLSGHTRSKAIGRPRAVAAFMLQWSGHGPSAIGICLGGRDHTTAIHYQDKGLDNSELCNRAIDLLWEIEHDICEKEFKEKLISLP